MKKYTPVSTTIISELILDDLYRLVALSLTPDYKGYSDTTFKQLAELTGDKESTIKDFIARIKKTSFVTVDSVKSDVTRNHYKFPIPINYRLITDKIVSLDASKKAKGLLIGIILQTLNNTNICKLSKNAIISKLRVSKSVALDCFRELEKANVIVLNKGQIEVSDSYMIVTHKKQKEEEKVIANFQSYALLMPCKQSYMAIYYLNNKFKIRNYESLNTFVESGVKRLSYKKDRIINELIIV